MEPGVVIATLADVVSNMERYRNHLLNDVEEVGVYGVAYNVSGYIIAIEKLIAEAKHAEFLAQG
jgi:hypothetical protein